MHKFARFAGIGGIMLYIIAALGFSGSVAISQSVPFNAFSVATLGGNCGQRGAVLYQSSGGQSKCLAAGSAGSFLQANGAGADVTWSGIIPGTGTVTSVALTAPAEFSVSGSPVTTAGTLDFAWDTQTANQVLAGPVGGIAATPTFRALVAADIPDLVPSLANNLTATGSTQGTALAITADFNNVTTVAANTGTILPAGAVVGQTLEVKNSGANSLNIYPPASQSIDTFALDAAVTLFPNSAARFTFDGATNWISR